MTAKGSAVNTTENCAQCNVLKQIESDVEQTVVFEKRGKIVILTEPRIENMEDLLAYKSQAMHRLNSLPPESFQTASVTFIGPLTIEEVEKILDGVDIRRLRFVSKPFGGGELSYPPVTGNMEQSVTKYMIEHNGIDDFRLIEGYVAAEIQGATAVLQSIQKKAHVFLVDVGAIEMHKEYREATIMVDDIYYRYEKYAQ